MNALDTAHSNVRFLISTPAVLDYLDGRDICAVACISKRHKKGCENERRWERRVLLIEPEHNLGANETWKQCYQSFLKQEVISSSWQAGLKQWNEIEEALSNSYAGRLVKSDAGKSTLKVLGNIVPLLAGGATSLATTSVLTKVETLKLCGKIFVCITLPGGVITTVQNASESRKVSVDKRALMLSTAQVAVLMAGFYVFTSACTVPGILAGMVVTLAIERGLPYVQGVSALVGASTVPGVSERLKDIGICFDCRENIVIGVAVAGSLFTNEDMLHAAPAAICGVTVKKIADLLLTSNIEIMPNIFATANVARHVSTIVLKHGVKRIKLNKLQTTLDAAAGTTALLAAGVAVGPAIATGSLAACVFRLAADQTMAARAVKGLKSVGSRSFEIVCQLIEHVEMGSG